MSSEEEESSGDRWPEPSDGTAFLSAQTASESGELEAKLRTIGCEVVQADAVFFL